MSLVQISINGMNYVSYASVAEADIFLEIDPLRGPEWRKLTEPEKGRHLVAATRRVDLEEYIGEKTVTSQVNQWPRRNAICDGVAIPDNVAPRQVEYATIIIAGSVPLNVNATSAYSSNNTGIQEVTSGPVSVKFGTYESTHAMSSSNLRDLNADAFAHLKCLLRGSASGASGITSSKYGSAFGTGGGPSFEPSGGPGTFDGIF